MASPRDVLELNLYVAMMKQNPIPLLLLGFMLFAAACTARRDEPSWNGRSLSSWLEDIDPRKPRETRKEAARALVAMGNAVHPHLVHWLEDTNMSDSAMRATWAYQALGPNANHAVPALTKLLNDPATAGQGALALLGIGPKAAAPLNRALNSTNHQVQIAAAWALSAGSTDDVSQLLTKLSDPNPEVRWKATLYLGSTPLSIVDQKAPLIVPQLIKSLGDPDAGVRQGSAICLGAFAEHAKAAVPALNRALSDENQNVRSMAEVSLKAIESRTSARPKQ